MRLIHHKHPLVMAYAGKLLHRIQPTLLTKVLARLKKAKGYVQAMPYLKLLTGIGWPALRAAVTHLKRHPKQLYLLKPISELVPATPAQRAELATYRKHLLPVLMQAVRRHGELNKPLFALLKRLKPDPADFASALLHTCHKLPMYSVMIPTQTTARIEALVALGVPAIPALLRAARHKHPTCRVVALYALVWLKAPQKQLLPLLHKALKGKSDNAFYHAIPLLRWPQTRSATLIPPLLNCAKASQRTYRSSTCYKGLLLQGPQGISALRKQLQQQKKLDRRALWYAMSDALWQRVQSKTQWQKKPKELPYPWAQLALRQLLPFLTRGVSPKPRSRQEQTFVTWLASEVEIIHRMLKALPLKRQLSPLLFALLEKRKTKSPKLGQLLLSRLPHASSKHQLQMIGILQTIAPSLLGTKQVHNALKSLAKHAKARCLLLRHMSPDALRQQLAAARKQKDEHHLRCTIRALTRLPRPTSQKLLIGLLQANDLSHKARQLAAQTLPTPLHPASRATIVTMLKKSKQKREASFGPLLLVLQKTALTAPQHRLLQQPLLALLKRSNASNQAKTHAILLLSRHKATPKVLAALLALLKAPKTYHSLRIAAIHGLGNIALKTPSSRPQIIREFRDLLHQKKRQDALRSGALVRRNPLAKALLQQLKKWGGQIDAFAPTLLKKYCRLHYSLRPMATQYLQQQTTLSKGAIQTLGRLFLRGSCFHNVVSHSFLKTHGELLSKQKSPALLWLKRGLFHSSPLMRRVAVQSLSRHAKHKPSVRTYLQYATLDPAPKVRQLASKVIRSVATSPTPTKKRN